MILEYWYGGTRMIVKIRTMQVQRTAGRELDGTRSSPAAHAVEETFAPPPSYCLPPYLLFSLSFVWSVDELRSCERTSALFDVSEDPADRTASEVHRHPSRLAGSNLTPLGNDESESACALTPATHVVRLNGRRWVCAQGNIHTAS